MENPVNKNAPDNTQQTVDQQKKAAAQPFVKPEQTPGQKPEVKDPAQAPHDAPGKTPAHGAPSIPPNPNTNPARK